MIIHEKLSLGRTLKSLQNLKILDGGVLGRNRYIITKFSTHSKNPSKNLFMKNVCGSIKIEFRSIQSPQKN